MLAPRVRLTVLLASVFCADPAHEAYAKWVHDTTFCPVG